MGAGGILKAQGCDADAAVIYTRKRKNHKGKENLQKLAA